MTGFWYAISCLWVGTLFYGIYFVLFCICIYILVNKPRNLANTIFLVTAITLFTLATVQAVINLILGAADIDGIDIPYDQLGTADMMIYVVNNVIADGLVIYRCYTIWNHNLYVVILPIIMVILTSVIGWDVLLPLNPFFALSLATNILVTALTAGRIWWICRQARAYLKTEVQKRCVSSISILIESGVIYSASVLTYLILGAIPGTEVVQEPLLEMLAQVVGIVPTLIIVRVGMGLSVQSVEGTANTATMSAEARPRKRPLLAIIRPDKYCLDEEESPATPSSIEKGGRPREFRAF